MKVQRCVDEEIIFRSNEVFFTYLVLNVSPFWNKKQGKVYIINNLKNNNNNNNGKGEY